MWCNFWLMRTTLILKQTLIMIFSRIILLNEVGNIDKFLFSVFFKANHHFEENRYTGYLPTYHNMLLFKIINFSTEKNFLGQVGVNSPSKKVVCYFGPFHRPSLALSGISPLHILLASWKCFSAGSQVKTALWFKYWGIVATKTARFHFIWLSDPGTLATLETAARVSESAHQGDQKSINTLWIVALDGSSEK